MAKTTWAGEYISAGFLAYSDFYAQLPTILRQWGASGILPEGTAEWIPLHPQRASYDEIMEGYESYETSWDGGAEALADRATTHTLVGLEVPFEWEEGTGAIRMHIIVNDDDSLAIYVDAPYFEVYERHPQHHGVANIERFIRLASCVFAPSVFLYGHIGVESYLPSLQNILALRAEITDDWAFYGKDLVPHLRILDTLRHQAVQCTEIGQDGVFVRWSNWWQNAYSPQAWKDSLKCVRQHLVRK